MPIEMKKIPLNTGPERQHVRQCLQAVLRLRYDEPGDEGTDGNGKPGRRGHQGNADSEETDAKSEQVPVAEEYDPVQRAPHHEPPADHQHDHDEQSAQEFHAHRAHVRGSDAGQHRKYQDERQYAQILKQQHGDDRSPLRRVEFGPVRVGLGDDGGGGHGGDGAVEDGLTDRDGEGRRQPGDAKQRQAHLQRSADENGSRPLAHVRQRQFQSNGEEKECDPEFGQDFDLLGIADQPKPVGSHQHTCQQKSDQRRYRRTVRQCDDGDRHPDEQRQID